MPPALISDIAMNEREEVETDFGKSRLGLTGLQGPFFLPDRAVTVLKLNPSPPTLCSIGANGSQG